MHLTRALILEGEDEDVREAVRAYWLGEGYTEGRTEPRALIFHRLGGVADALLSRIERVAANVVVRLGESMPDENGRPRIMVTVSWRLLSRIRVVTRIDALYVELEIDGLRRYVERGVRPATADRLARLRRPVSTAVMVNLFMSVVLVGAVGLVADLGLGATCAVAAGVALINVISILGFADVVVEGMESIRPTVGERD